MKSIDSTGRARRAASGLVVVMVLLALPACYEFPVPLDPEPRLKPDARLVGAWRCVPSEPTIPPDLRVRTREGDLVMALKFEARNLRYGIRLVGMDKPDEEAAWEGFASELGERTVLNLRAISEKPEEDPKQVTLVSYTLLSKDVVQFDLIDDKPVKGKPLSPSSELRKTLLSHRPQSDLFSPFMVCVRAKIEDPS
jgi:hypothetical protein